MTSSFIVFSTGIDSPVIIDSSIDVRPFSIIPSTGIFSPGLIFNISPTTTSSIGIMISLLSRITLASLACKFNKDDKEFVV